MVKNMMKKIEKHLKKYDKLSLGIVKCSCDIIIGIFKRMQLIHKYKFEGQAKYYDDGFKLLDKFLFKIIDEFKLYQQQASKCYIDIDKYSIKVSPLSSEDGGWIYCRNSNIRSYW